LIIKKLLTTPVLETGFFTKIFVYIGGFGGRCPPYYSGSAQHKFPGLVGPALSVVEGFRDLNPTYNII